MVTKVKETIEKYSLLSPGDKVLVGVSGGADSMCLLAVLQELQEVYDLQLVVVHVNHGIRGSAADSDEAFVEKYARTQGLPFFSRHLAIPTIAKERKISEEEAGRLLRYEVFAEIAEAEHCQAVAVAHHREDQAETVLLNLARGTNLRGMGGMRPKRDRIIRPLLFVSRSEIENYLAKKEILYCTDATNEEDVYTRNFVRHQVIPDMNRVNEKACEHISQLAEDLSEAYQLLFAMARDLYRSNHKKEAKSILLPIDVLCKQSSMIQGEMFLCAFSELAGRRKDVGRTHVAAALSLLQAENGKKVTLPYGIEVNKEYDWLRVKKDADPPSYCIALGTSGEYFYRVGDENWVLRVDLQNYTADWIISENTYTKMLDYDKIYAMLELRTPEPEDRIRIYEEGGSKKLTRLFTNAKVPQIKRASWPVVAAGQEIVWAIGLRYSEAFKIDSETKRVLVLTAARVDETEDIENHENKRK